MLQCVPSIGRILPGLSVANDFGWCQQRYVETTGKRTYLEFIKLFWKSLFWKKGDVKRTWISSIHFIKSTVLRFFERFFLLSKLKPVAYQLNLSVAVRTQYRSDFARAFCGKWLRVMPTKIRGNNWKTYVWWGSKPALQVKNGTSEIDFIEKVVS